MQLYLFHCLPRPGCGVSLCAEPSGIPKQSPRCDVFPLKGTKAVPDMVETMVGTISKRRGADEAFDSRSIWCK